jgi:hypothetical protein
MQGYRIEKGFQRYMCGGGICRDCNGKAYTGYMVYDYSTNMYVWDSYDQYYTHRWSLDDVEEFLKGVYKEAGLEY